MLTANVKSVTTLRTAEKQADCEIKKKKNRRVQQEVPLVETTESNVEKTVVFFIRNNVKI